MREAAKSSTSRPKPRSESVAAFLGRWLDDAARHLAPRTTVAYRQVVDAHIVPAIGRIRIGDLEPPDVSRMVTGMLAEGYSPQTAKHAHKVLRVALGQAVRWGAVERNVAALVKSPRVVKATVPVLSASDARRFLDAVADDPRWPLWLLAFTTGMRRGELLALRWSDIDLDRAELHVNATLRQVSRYRFAYDPPKTEKSRRVIPLTREAVAALRVQLAAATSTVVVFARPDGRPLPPAEVTREFQAALTAHGFPKVTFHSLRHSGAQAMLDSLGGDIRAVSAILGHSTISTTVDIYGGAADDARRRARDAMQRVLDAPDVRQTADK